ncbi:MAG: ribosome biogenesis GTP-binding protein YihA/YsxC [Bacteroidota bacterium]
MIDIKAEFLKSSQKISQLPPDNLPEYAFVGRSNVGKSSLINLLTGRKNLAKTSGKPGKTRLINHFTITNPSNKEQWFLVDLPGYGYARVSKKERDEFQRLIYPYIKNRKNLMCLFVLIDVRHEPQPIDLNFMTFLGQNGVPFAMIFTKCDKMKPGGLQNNVEVYNENMLETWEELPTQFLSSSAKGQGREEILGFIEETNQLF